MRSKIVLVFIFSLLVFTACNSKEARFNDRDVTLRVAYSDQRQFMEMYGNSFKANYPTIQIEVVSLKDVNHPDHDYNMEYDKLMAGENIDVLFLSANIYERYVREGRLVQLDRFISEDQFDIENIHPSVVEILKNKGLENIYGLAPTVLNSTLFYNRTLFEQNGVSLPTDGMTMNEVMELAMRFPTDGPDEERVYGFYERNVEGGLIGLMQSMGNAQGLTYVDSDTMTVWFNTESWKQIVEEAILVYSSGVIGERAHSEQDLFAIGRAAMTINYYIYVDELERVQHTMNVPDYDWQLAAVPAFPENRNQSNRMSINGIFAVNVNSAHAEAAWELVKFINSDEVAKARSKTTYDLLARSEHMKEKHGRSLEAFYKLEPDVNYYSELMDVPNSFRINMMSVFQEEMTALLEGRQSVEQTLISLEQRGQFELDQAVAEAIYN